MKKFKIHPYTLISESVRNGFFEELIDCLLDVINEFQKEHSHIGLDDISIVGEDEDSFFDSDFESSQLTKELFEEDIWKFFEICLEDENQSLLKQYFERAKNILTYEKNNSQDGWEGWFDKTYDYDIFHDLIYYFVTEDINPNYLDLTNIKDHFILNDLRGRPLLENEVFYLSAPFVHFLWYPVKDYSLYRKLKTECSIALTGDDPILLGDLKRKLTKQGLKCKRSYLYSLIVNDEHFLTYVKDKEILVDRADEIINDFEHLSATTSPNKYFVKDDVDNIYVFGNLNKEAYLHESALNRIIRYNSVKGFAESVDREELAFKLLMGYDQSSQSGSSELDEIYDKVIDVVARKGKITSWLEICRALNLRDLPLDPYHLGPGRLMAYAPGKRFLVKKESAYVLKEWVETDQRARGKILKDRIVTPFEDKAFSFSKDLFFEQLSENQFYNKYLIVCMDEASLNLALKLDSKPTEIYYLTKIKELMRDFLGQNYIFMGRGSHYLAQVEDDERPKKDQSLSNWRIELVSKRLGTDKVYLSSNIESLDEGERVNFYKILGKHSF